MSTLNSPILHGDAETPLGQAFSFLAPAVLEQLVEKFDVGAAGIVSFWGSLAGSGSDTGRVRRATGYGFGATFAPMATETSPIALSAIQAAFDDITLARHGLGFSETFMRRILSGDGLTLEFVAAQITDSWLRYLRYQACVVGATYATNPADASATLDVDDALAVAAHFEETSGYGGQQIKAVHRARQLTRLKASINAQGSLQFPEQFEKYQGVKGSDGFRFRFLDIDWHASGDVVNSSGDDFGFAHVEGALGYVVGGTESLTGLAGVDPQVVPDMGLVVTRETNGRDSVSAVYANTYLGVAKLDATVAPQCLIRNDDGV